MGRTLHHPHLPTTFPDYAHDPRVGDCILDLHRGTVDFLQVSSASVEQTKQLTFNFLVSFKSLYI
jgi:hypothetical protein